MADTLAIGEAISAVQSGRGVLSPAALSGERLNRVDLDDGLRPPAFAEVRAVLGGADTKTALSIAIVAGNGIIGALKALKSSADLAGRDSLVSTLTGLSLGGTRVSRLNLDVDTNRALALIDRLVGNSELSNANFISSTSPNIRIGTTRFGGTLDVAPQPLDSAGLNLTGISLLTRAAADDAAARLETAINTATRRVQGLEALQRAITNGDFSGQVLSALISGTSGDGLPVGTLVNVVG